jgi:4-amino-4-deoxy-L-arabinose transferase-like glycosyltransferase
MKRQHVWFIVALLLLSAAGVALELYAMRTGPGVRGDSVRYVMGARNLLAGNGFSRLSGGGEIFPETGFAPMLSFVLAGFGLGGIDLYAGVRVLNALLFGASIFLTGRLIADASRSPWVGLLGAALILTAPNVVRWHAWLMSEALFIFLTLVALAGLAAHVRTGGWLPLFVSGVAAGMAGLTRYVGVSLIPVGVLGILLWGVGSRRDRITRAAMFGLLAALPFALWMIRNGAVGGAGLANRQIRYHPFRPEAIRVFLFEPTTWVLPATVILPRTMRGALAFALMAVGPALFLIRAARRIPRTRPSGTEGAVLPWLLLILLPCYVGVLAVNSLLLDAATTYDGILRYLTPLFVLLVLLELTTYALAFPTGRGRWMLGLVLAAWMVVALGTNTFESLTIARDSTYQVGFTRIRDEWLDLASELNAAPTIVSDNPEMVYYLIDRPAYMIPIKYDTYRQVFREDFLQQVDLARTRLEAGAVLVIFEEPSDEEAEVIDLLQVVPLRIYDDVVIYGYPS